MTDPHPGPDDVRRLLCQLGASLRDAVLADRRAHGIEQMASVTGRVEADVLYAVDRLTEREVRRWLDAHWPASLPVRLVMEGVDDHEWVTAPEQTQPDAVRGVLVVDPVDGTRNLMYDKRPAWALCAFAPVAPGNDRPPRLGDITVAAMTEIPITKQWRADQVSAIKGRGRAGIVAEALDVRSGDCQPLTLTPSSAVDVDHGFASFSHYLPDGKARLAAIEQALWDDLMPPGGEPRHIFEDQYLCSAGQLYEVLSGRDRLVGELRALVLEAIGLSGSLCCHPYDVCTSLILTEAGGVFESPSGGPVDVPLDTTTPVAWVAYANETLAALIRPRLGVALEQGLRQQP